MNIFKKYFQNKEKDAEFLRVVARKMVKARNELTPMGKRLGSSAKVVNFSNFYRANEEILRVVYEVLKIEGKNTATEFFKIFHDCYKETEEIERQTDTEKDRKQKQQKIEEKKDRERRKSSILG
jgi:hypothetical protein